MNAHTPFDANQDWTNPYCQNSSNDPMVDALLGNAYHVVRTVYCNLGNLKLLYDFLNQYGMVIGVNSEEELKALSTQVKYSRIYGFSRAGDRQVTDFLYVEGDRTGIIPDDPEATGSWITVATSGSNGGGGTSSGDGAYIPWVYANGSAIGGETIINVPDGTVGVPFIIVNGDMQYVGRGFEFNADNLSVTLAQSLEEGDEVVFLLTGVPAVPDNPHVNDWVQINWLYNNGAAVGGEQVIAIPYTFQSVPAVYKNGLRLAKNLATNSYLIDTDNQSIILTEPLTTNDRVIIQIGGEARVVEVSDRTVQEIARSLNVSDSAVILSTNTTSTLNGKKFLYSVEQQRVYELPPLPSNIYISAVSGQTLTYNPGEIQVTLKEVITGKVLQSRIEAPDGATLYPELQIARWRDDGDVRGWGAKADGVTDDSAAFIAAANAVGEGGVIRARGNFLLKTIALPPISIQGDGQGKTILIFDNASGQNDGIVFSAPTKQDIEFGCRHLSIKTVGGHGRYAINCPRGAGLNGLRPKPTFKHISFYSEKTNAEFEGFSQVWSWQFMFLLGDAWNLTINHIDAVGCYQAKIDYRTQFLDGFIRSTPAEGILSMRLENTTCHNIANFFEIQQKTYFCMTNIDCARSLRGVYDAPDRVFETNRSAYGESIWTNVIINSQLEPVRLDSRFYLVTNGVAIHRAANAFDHGQEWVGLNLTRARACSFHGLEIGTASGYSGRKVGIRLDAGDANNFTNVAFGMLDVGFQVGDNASSYGANHGTNVVNVSVIAKQDVLFNLQSCRNFHCFGYGKSSAYPLNTFLTVGSDAGNTYNFSGIEGYDQYTDNSHYWYNSAAGANEKRWRFDTRSGFVLSTQTDTGAVGNNGLILSRSGVAITKAELRADQSSGYVLLTGSSIQAANYIKPTVDNAFSNGNASFRWSQVYAGAGSINTSDEDDKYRMTADEQTREAERRAALEIKADMWRFKFRDAVAEKGQENARIHFGVGAQSVGDILRKHGLNPQDYAFWCYDEWDDIYEPEMAIRSVINEDTGESWEEEYATGRQVIVKKAGGKYGIRYEELLCFIIAAL